MRKVTYLNDVGVPEIETPPPERLPPVGYFAKGAVLIGLFVFTLLGVFLTIFNVDLILTLKISIAVSVAAMTGYGVYSLALFTTFDWREAEKERKRRWEIEDYERWKTENSGGAPLPSQPTHGEKLDHLARLLLERHFLDSLPATREASEAAGLCTQDEWNTVNAVFKETGIKGPKDFRAADFPTALALWREKVRVEPDAILVLKADKNWKRIKL